MSPRRIAITGGAGRLGRHVVRALEGAFEVTVVDRVPLDGVPGVVVDIFDAYAVRRAFEGAEAVIHLAGLDLDTPASGEAYVHANGLGTYAVLNAARETGARRVVVCSSVAATGLSEARDDWAPLYLPVDEDHPCCPRHPYGVSKRMAEVAAASFIAGDFDVITLRPMLVMFAANLAVVRHHRQNRPRWLHYYIDPDDAGRAFRAALEAPPGTSGTFFVTAQDTCHEQPTLDWLSRSLDRLPEIRDPQLYADNPRASIFDGGRASRILGFRPASNWLTLLAHLAETA